MMACPILADKLGSLRVLLMARIADRVQVQAGSGAGDPVLLIDGAEDGALGDLRRPKITPEGQNRACGFVGAVRNPDAAPAGFRVNLRLADVQQDAVGFGRRDVFHPERGRLRPPGHRGVRHEPECPVPHACQCVGTARYDPTNLGCQQRALERLRGADFALDALENGADLRMVSGRVKTGSA